MTDSREGPDTVVEIFPGGVIVEVMERFLHHISVESDMRALPSFTDTKYDYSFKEKTFLQFK